MAVKWDEKTDYMAEMNKYAAMGDYESAAEAERKRNAKIDALGLDYEKTNAFQEYQPFEREEFKYDYKKDDSYKAYAKEYTRNMQRAVEDTMGKYAGMTGGIPSTAAMSAATQAGAYEMSKLSDKIPELEQLAYQRYFNEQNQKYNEYVDARDFDYGMRTDMKNWNYKMLQDGEERGWDHFEVTGDADGLPGEYYTPEAKKMLEDAYAKSQNKQNFSEALNMVSELPVEKIIALYPGLSNEEIAVLEYLSRDRSKPGYYNPGDDVGEKEYTNNNKTENGVMYIEVGGRYYTLDEIEKQIGKGFMQEVKNADGTYSFEPKIDERDVIRYGI